jgi:hypothetical protein
MRKLAILLALAAVTLTAIAALLGTATTAGADPNLPNIPAHRHFIQLGDGSLVQVGPRVCDDASLQNAFNEFHSNIHIAVAGSPGPAQPAPGLHDHRSPDIVSRPCSFTP